MKIKMILLIAALLSSCSTMNNNEQAIPGDLFNVKLLETENSYILAIFANVFRKDAEKFNLVQSIGSMELIDSTGIIEAKKIFPDENNLAVLKNMDIKTNIMKINMPGTDQILFFASKKIAKSVYSIDEKGSIKIKVFGETGKAENSYSITKKITDIFCRRENSEPIDMIPYVRLSAKGIPVFGLRVFRNYIIEDEYIPNSEILKVELVGPKGNVVWKSGEGANYLQVITPVYPENPGEIYDYEVFYRGKNSNNSKLKPGKYTARYVIPANPTPYYTEYEFEWK